MESFTQPGNEITTATVIAILCVGGLVSLVISGWSMKWANYICGGPEAGVLRSTLAFIVCIVFGSAASIGATILDPAAPPWTVMLFVSVASAIGISLVLHQSPWRAVGTYIMFSLIVGFMHLGMFLIVALWIQFAVPLDMATKFAERAAAIGDINTVALRERFEDSTKETLPADPTHQSAKQQTYSPEEPSAPGIAVNPFAK